MKRTTSNFNGDDFNKLELEIQAAKDTYQQRVEAYNYSVSKGHHSYAKRKRKPEMEAAKKHLDALMELKNSMLQSNSHEQGIDLVDQSANLVNTTEEQPFPWSTVGLLGVGLVVIIVLFKIL